MWISLLGWINVVGAQELVQTEVESVIEAPSTPKVWVECNPISGLMELEKMLPNAYRDSTKGLGEIGMDGFAKLGGDPNGSLIAYGSEELTMKIPYVGTAETVTELLNVLQDDAEVWQTGKNEWQMELVDDHWTAVIDDGYINIQSLDAEEKVELPNVLSEMSKSHSAEGCWVMVSSDMNIPKTKIPLDGGLFLPFGQDPFSLLFSPKESLPMALAGTGATPLVVRTPDVPAIIMTLGFDWAELFADPTIQKRLQLSEKEANKISRRLRIQSGGIVAFQDINIRDNPQISVALELHNRFGKPQSTWLIWRGIQRSLRQAGLEPVELDKRILSFVNKDQVFYAGVDNGRLFLGNTKASIENMMLNEGTEWVTGSFAEFAQEHPVSLLLSVPQMIGTLAGGLDRVEVGVRSVDEFAQITLDVKMTHDGSWTGLLPFLAGQLPEPSPEAPISESQRHIRHLAVKQHQHFIQEGSYLPIGQTGIFEDTEFVVPASLLDNAPVTPSASSLGWIEQPKDAMYWVETTEDTFTVHGVFVWENTLMHYTKDHNGQISAEPVE